MLSCNPHGTIFILLLCVAVFVNSKPLPIIIDTDIGDDFDDSWALTEAISSPDKWDVRMVLTAFKNTPARAQIVAKYLTRYNRTDIPIGIGVKTSDDIGGLYPWASDFDLDAYNRSTGGKVHADGVLAAKNLLMSSSEPITFVAIAPESNFGAIVEKYPEVITRVSIIYGMFGAVYYCYNHVPIKVPGSCHEYNVARDVAASQKMATAAWPMVITPLDTCDIVMDGKPWQNMQAANNSNHPLVSTLLESMNVWGNFPPGCKQSDVIYDAVAMYMSHSLTVLNMKELNISVTDAGATIEDPRGKLMNIALTWTSTGLSDFLTDLSNMIISPKTMVPTL